MKDMIKDVAWWFAKAIAKLGVFVGVCLAIIAGLNIIVKAFAVPTVYAVYEGDKPCEYAKDAQGELMPCAQALKGRYEVRYIAPKTLREKN